MQTISFSRLIAIVVLPMAILLGACSPSGNPIATTVPGANLDGSFEMSSTNAEAAVRSFYQALFSGEDVAAFVCSGADAAEVKQIHSRVAQTYIDSGAVIDTSGLTVSAGETEPGKALVMITGNLSVDQAGVKTDVPVVVPPTSVSLEGNSWKICPAS